jgi:hypothetical protein
MARPILEVADIFRDHGPAWREANRGHVSLLQLKVMSAIECCRTAALGGHVARCENEACGRTHVAFNSCRNRHCPKCHVWTAPAVQEESGGSAIDRVRSCMRPVVATAMVAGHDVIRGLGPNQGVALINRVALRGFSQSNGSTVSHHLVFTPAIRERYATSLDASWPCCQASSIFICSQRLSVSSLRQSDVVGSLLSWSEPPRRRVPSCWLVPQPQPLLACARGAS